MTLPGTIGLEQADELSRQVGIALGVYAADETSSIEVQRAPDSAGSPNVGAAVTVTVLPRGAEVFVDVLPQDGARRHYRIRHVSRGADPSSWTCWTSAIPGVLPRRIARAAAVAPIIARTRAVSGTTGTLTLTITDPQCRVTLVEFRTKVGAGAYTSWATDAVVPYETTVAITAAQLSLIGYRVTGFDGDGRSRVLAEGEEVFDDSHLVQALAVAASFDEDGALKVRIVGDSHTGSIRVAVSTSAFPSSGTVGAVTAVDGRQSEWSFAGPYTLGQAVYISAIAYTGAAGAGTASDKIDCLVYRSNSATSKTIRMPAAGLLMSRGATPVATIDETTGVAKMSSGSYNVFLPLPKGATLTAVRMRSYASSDTTDGFNELKPHRKNQDDTVTQLGSTASTATNDVWETVTVSSLSEDTSGDRSYFAVIVSHTPLGLGTPDRNEIAWIEYDIDVPSVDVST